MFWQWKLFALGNVLTVSVMMWVAGSHTIGIILSDVRSYTPLPEERGGYGGIFLSMIIIITNNRSESLM